MSKYLTCAALIASAISISSACASERTSLGNGFAYLPIGSGQCNVLFDEKYDQPIFETSKRLPPKVVLIGPRADCPKEYNGYDVLQLKTGRLDGYIYTAFSNGDRRIYIYRKAGSRFILQYGPASKK